MLAYSYDGSNWVSKTLTETFSVSAIAFGSNTFAAGGFQNRILESGPVVALGLRNRPMSELIISGPPGSYRIEASSILDSSAMWSTQANLNVVSEPYYWPITTANPPTRFYRAAFTSE